MNEAPELLPDPSPRLKPPLPLGVHAPGVYEEAQLLPSSPPSVPPPPAPRPFELLLQPPAAESAAMMAMRPIRVAMNRAVLIVTKLPVRRLAPSSYIRPQVL